MKIKTFVLAGLIALWGCSTEQEVTATDVPPAVIAAFNAKYPTAEDSEWEIEKEGDNLLYEVDFEIDGKDMEAHFRPDGSVVDED